MAKPLKLTLNSEQREELETIRDNHAKPYLRERAAALLKIADGQSGRQVARHGLYKERDEDSVYEWLHRYLAEGVKGLRIQPGRGRKAAFFPSASDK